MPEESETSPSGAAPPNPERTGDAEPGRLQRAKHWLNTNVEEGDAPRGHVVLYSIGNIESAVADRLPEQLKNILVVAFHMNPMIVGLIYALKTAWDSITDPVMAHITDSSRTKWGRRIPFIFFGSVTRVLFLFLFCLFIPTGLYLSSNKLMEAQKHVNRGSQTIMGARTELVRILDQIPGETPQNQEILLDIVRDYTGESGEDSLTYSRQRIRDNLPILREDLKERRDMADQRREEMESVYADLGVAPETGTTIRRISEQLQGARTRFEAEETPENRETVDTLEAQLLEIRESAGLDNKEFEVIRTSQGRLKAAEEKVAVAEKLVEKGEKALREFVGADILARHALAAYSPNPQENGVDPGLAERQSAQIAADVAFTELGFDAFNIFEVEAPPLPVRGPKPTMWDNISSGFVALVDPVNIEDRKLFLYVLVGVLIFTTLTTVQSVPSWALGIELCPSYNGRTQVVVYRSVFTKIVGLLSPWLPVLTFALIFANAKDGLIWLSLFAVFIGIPTTVLMCKYVRERTDTSVVKRRPNLFRSMYEIARIPEFLRILALFMVMGWVTGLTSMVGFYLNVYWVMGSALSGATLAAGLGTLAWGLGLVSLPVINWACRKFQKHWVMAAAAAWMGIGNILAWWAITPENPYYQAILPFFFSLGIGSVYTVLPTMMADATDLDEYHNGVRREGMFGAVMSFIMKMIGTLTPFLAGLLVTISGFDPALEYRQLPETIFNMRLIVVFVPFSLTVITLFLLIKYPLNRERVNHIKAALKERHAKLKAEDEGEQPAT